MRSFKACFTVIISLVSLLSCSPSISYDTTPFELPPGGRSGELHDDS